jgi:hypothetical protein
MGLNDVIFVSVRSCLQLGHPNYRCAQQIAKPERMSFGFPGVASVKNSPE